MSASSASWLAACGGAACALVAFTFERAVRLFPWTRVDEIEDRPKRQRLLYSVEHVNPVTTVCVILGCLGLATMCLGIVSVMDGLSGARGASRWVELLVLMVAVVLFCWVVPELVARHRPNEIVGFWVPLIARLVTRAAFVTGQANGEDDAGGEEGDDAEDVEEEARELYRSALRLQSIAASEIMTPRTDMVFVDDTATVDDALGVAVSSGHSRLPVFHGTRDEIVGIVYIKDLLKFLREAGGRETPVKGQAREPYFVPETKNVDDLLDEFRERNVHVGIVLDEYGGTAGLVTIEDIIEEIMGEIRDEHDHEEGEPIRRVDELCYELDAAVRVEELNEEIDLNLPEDEDFDTIAGYVSFRLGRLPSAGETFEYDGVRFTVLDADKRRVKRIRLQPLRDQR